MRKLFLLFFVTITVFGQSIQISEIAVLDSSDIYFRTGRHSMVKDGNEISFIYSKYGDDDDFICLLKSPDEGNTWENPQVISTFHRSPKIDRCRAMDPTAVYDDNHALHVLYRYDGYPVFTSGWDNYPPTHINYITNASGTWVETPNVINDSLVQVKQGNGNTVAYLNRFHIANFKGHQYFIADDYAWWAKNYNIVLSDNKDGYWKKGDALDTYNLGEIDNVILMSPSLLELEDTLYAIWYQRKDCTIEMKKFDGTNWSNKEILFNDKVFPAPKPTSYYIRVTHTQSDNKAIVGMLRNIGNYNELIYIRKERGKEWKVDTTNVIGTYGALEAVSLGDTSYFTLFNNYPAYNGIIIQHIEGEGFVLTKQITAKPDEMLFNIKATGDYRYPFVYIVKNKNTNKVYIKLGRLELNPTSVNEDNNLPLKFSLEQNYPNPFNPSTVIKFSIPNQSKVSLEVYNLLGEKVATLVNEELASGMHEVNFNTSNLNLSSGVYFYRLETPSFTEVKKMLLLK